MNCRGSSFCALCDFVKVKGLEQTANEPMKLYSNDLSTPEEIREENKN